MFNTISLCLQDGTFETISEEKANDKLLQERTLMWAQNTAGKLALLVS